MSFKKHEYDDIISKINEIQNKNLKMKQQAVVQLFRFCKINSASYKNYRVEQL